MGWGVESGEGACWVENLTGRKSEGFQCVFLFSDLFAFWGKRLKI